MTNRATWDHKGAPLSGEFGLSYACRIFGKTPEELEALVGRYSRGARKGQLRGWLRWAKTTRGGWVRTGSYDHDAQQGSGFVAPPNLTFGHGLYLDDKLVLGVDLTGPRSDPARLLRDAIMQMKGRQQPTPAPQPPQAPDLANEPVFDLDLPTHLYIGYQATYELLNSIDRIRDSEQRQRAQERMVAFKPWT